MKNLVYVVLAVVATMIAACNLFPPLSPFDGVDSPPPPTLEPAQDTCDNPAQITEPAFITGYMLFDTPQDSVLWQGGGISSYDLEDVLEVVFPSMTYRIYNPDPTRWLVFVEGTSDYHPTQLAIQCRADGAKWYMGWGDQFLTGVAGLTQEQFSELIDLYPSVNRFNFRETNYDSTFYIDAAWRILGECKEGRAWADFRFNPYPIPDTIITAFEQAGWDKVLH